MKEKVKKFSLGYFATILKSSLIGVITSILLVLVFAFVLKFVDLGSGIIAIVDQIIKIVSVFVAALTLKKVHGEKFLVKGLILGAMYAVITFIVFSVLNGGFNIGVGVLTDILFSTLVGGASAIILNLSKK